MECSNPLRILYFGSSAGLGLIRHLTENIISLHKQGLNIIVISDHREHEIGLFKRLNDLNIKVEKVENLESIFQISNYFKIAGIIKNYEIDLIQCQGIRQLFLAYIGKILAGKKNNIKISIYCHAYNHGENNEKITLLLMVWLYNLLADLIFPVSDRTKDVLIEHGLNKNKVITVNNVLNFNKIDAILNSIDNNREFLIEYLGPNYNSQKYLINISGSLVKRKGVEVSIYAMTEVLKKHPNLKLLISGDGCQKVELINLCKRLGLVNNIIFLGGRIDYDHLIKLVYYSEISIFSSKSETFGHAIVEPMALGKPIVTTDVGIADEIIIEGENGFCIPINDSKQMAEKIIFLLDNPEKAILIGKNGEKTVRSKFSADKIALQVKSIYLNSVLL